MQAALRSMEDIIPSRPRQPSPCNRSPLDHSSSSASTVSEPEQFAQTGGQSISDRLEHFTWAWFTITMSTGGVAIVIANIPFKFPGLMALGTAVFILNLILFVIFVGLISFRFWTYEWTLKKSLEHPTESLFVAAGLLSVATIIIGAQAYGGDKVGDWLQSALRVLFWTYSASAVLFTVAIHIVIWSTQTHTVDSMTPLWIFPIYPLLMVGPMAGAIAPRQDQTQALNIFITGIALQAVGFMIAVMIYAAYISRLMTCKLPISPARPRMFVSVGPSAFTVIALIKLGQASKRAFPPTFLENNGELAAKVVEIGATICGIWLWGLAFWFFLISVVANAVAVADRTLHYSLGWWSFVFPNTAFVLATFAVGNSMKSTAIDVVGTVLAVALVVCWGFIAVMTVRGVLRKQILWKDRDEDRDEGGYQTKATFVRRDSLRRLEKWWSSPH